VGWYATGGEVSDHSELIQQFYSVEVTDPIHVLVDTTLANLRLGVKAYICPAGELDKPLGPHFREVPISIIADDAERVGVDALIRANMEGPVKLGGTEREEGGILPDLDSLELSLQKVSGCLDRALAFVDSVASNGKTAAENNKVGRLLAAAAAEVPVVNRAEFEASLSTSIQDLVMVVYLSNLTKTQLSIAEKLQQLP
jgi:translation initiation factor 3 subunit F